MQHDLDATERAILDAAARIFAAHAGDEPLDKPAAKTMRKYALTQAYLMAAAIEEIRKGDDDDE